MKIILALLFFLYNLLKIVLTLLTHFSNTAWKVSVFGVILVRVFPHSNWVSLRIQSKSFRIKSECGKIQTRITPNTGNFSQWKFQKLYWHFSLISNTSHFFEKLPSLFQTLLTSFYELLKIFIKLLNFWSKLSPEDRDQATCKVLNVCVQYQTY